MTGDEKIYRKSLMKPLILTAITSVLILSFSPRAEATYFIGAELIEKCRSDKPEDRQACFGYVAGVIDYHVVMQSLGTAPTIDFCLPPDMPVTAAALAVIKYMSDAPQNGSFIASSSVVMALNKTFPCAKRRGK